MQCKEVLAKYHKMVPFPWTLPKISKAGYVPKEFLLDLGNELKNCSDADSGVVAKVIRTVSELK